MASPVKDICFHPRWRQHRSPFWQPDVFRPDVRPYRMANCRVPACWMFSSFIWPRGRSRVRGALPRPPRQCAKPACYPSFQLQRPHPPPLVTRASQLGSGGECVVWDGSQYPLDTSAPGDRHAALGRMDG